MTELFADESSLIEGSSPYLGILLMALITILFAAMLGTIVVV
ncbi:MAG: hypothetical protein ABEH59_11630 [Halobacteriales archaeon]